MLRSLVLHTNGRQNPSFTDNRNVCIASREALCAQHKASRADEGKQGGRGADEGMDWNVAQRNRGGRQQGEGPEQRRKHAGKQELAPGKVDRAAGARHGVPEVRRDADNRSKQGSERNPDPAEQRAKHQAGDEVAYAFRKRADFDVVLLAGGDQNDGVRRSDKADDVGDDQDDEQRRAAGDIALANPKMEDWSA